MRGASDESGMARLSRWHRKLAGQPGLQRARAAEAASKYGGMRIDCMLPGVGKRPITW